MAQQETVFTPPPPTYITPIQCPHCTGTTHLMRRSPAPAANNGAANEVRTFQCAECDKKTEMLIAY